MPITDQTTNTNLGIGPLFNGLGLPSNFPTINIDQNSIFGNYGIPPSDPGDQQTAVQQAADTNLSNDGEVITSGVHDQTPDSTDLLGQIPNSKLSKRGKTNPTGKFEGVPQNVAAVIRGYSVPNRSEVIPPILDPIDITFNSMPQPTYLNYLKAANQI